MTFCSQCGRGMPSSTSTNPICHVCAIPATVRLAASSPPQTELAARMAEEVEGVISNYAGRIPLATALGTLLIVALETYERHKE